MKPSIIISFAAASLLLAKTVPAQVPKNDKVVIVLENQLTTIKGKAALPITNTPEAKFTPVWSPNGSEIAFLDDTKTNVRLPELVFVSETGHVRLRTQLFPNLSPGESVTDVVPRGLAIDGYINSESLILEGSINRWVCDFVFVDPLTGKITRQILGQCGTLSISPDQKHALVEANLRASSADFWRDGLGLDGASLYPSGPSSIRFLSDPAWSPDSQSIGLVERNVDTGTRDMVIINRSGSVSHATLPSNFGGTGTDPLDDSHPVTADWVNGQFVAKDGALAFQNTSGNPTAREIGPEVGAYLDEERRHSTQAVSTRRSRLELQTGIRDALDAAYDIWPPTNGRTGSLGVTR